MTFNALKQKIKCNSYASVHNVLSKDIWCFIHCSSHCLTWDQCLGLRLTTSSEVNEPVVFPQGMTTLPIGQHRGEICHLFRAQPHLQPILGPTQPSILSVRVTTVLGVRFQPSFWAIPQPPTKFYANLKFSDTPPFPSPSLPHPPPCSPSSHTKSLPGKVWTYINLSGFGENRYVTLITSVANNTFWTRPRMRLISGARV